jgi:transcriptional regulator with XRE-family HTH domain
LQEPIVVAMDESLDVVDQDRPALPATVARLVLGRRLKALREGAMLSTDEAAEHALLSRATLWRMEKGDTRCRYHRADVELLAHLYHADGERALLNGLARATRGWRERYPELLPDRAKEYLDLESHADRIDWYASHLVPDLLRTTGYAASVADARPGPEAMELCGLVEIHALRQALLDRSEPAAPTVRLVLDEAVLRGLVAAGGAMAEQLTRIAEVAGLPHVSVRVLPLGHGIHAGLHTGPFVVLGFPEIPGAGALPSVVYRDAARVAATESGEVAVFEAVFRDLYRRALDDASSSELIRRCGRG